jgi:hypothetical protein
MPIAVAKASYEGERFDLKTAPPDGFVVLKRLSYGQKMFRRGLLSKARMETAATGNRAERRANAKKGTTSVELELTNSRVTLFEFSNCIVDHNLQDAMGEKLDFSNPDHVQMLDGRIGEEIDELINDLNDFEAEDDTGK